MSGDEGYGHSYSKKLWVQLCSVKWLFVTRFDIFFVEKNLSGFSLTTDWSQCPAAATLEYQIPLLAVAYLRGRAFCDAPCRVAHAIFTKKPKAQYMNVWCEAICCRHIYFKTAFQSESENAIFINTNKKWLFIAFIPWRGACTLASLAINR